MTVCEDMVGTDVIENLFASLLAGGWSPREADLYVQGYQAGYWKRGERDRLRQLQPDDDYSAVAP